MRNKFFFILVSVFLFQEITLKAQLLSKDANNPAMKVLIAGKTYAVLTNDDGFNEWFRATLEKHWTATPLQIISSVELDSFVKSDKNVFLFAQARDDRGATMHLLTGDDLNRKKEFMFLLAQGGYKQTKYLFTPATSGPKVIAGFRYSPERAEETAGMLESEMLIALLNQSLHIVIDNKIKGSVRDSIKERICLNAPQIKEKTLLFNQAYEDGTIELDKKVIISDKAIDDYPFNYELVSKFELENKLNDGSINPCYLFLYFPSSYVNQAEDSGDILVYDPIQKKIIYLEDNMDGPWFEKWEMKEMVYLIKE